jgi:uncharacterized protein YjbK
VSDEIELKLLLPDEENFLRLRNALDGLATPEVVEQVVYYLDTARLDLRLARQMLRVRVGNGVAKVTWKGSATMTAGVQQAAEREQVLPEAEGALWRQGGQARTTPERLGIVGWLDLAADVGLHPLGAMANTRRIYRATIAGVPMVLELDRVRYSAGVERYELEVEHADAARLAQRLIPWLEANSIETEPASESKYAQFLRLSASTTT